MIDKDISYEDRRLTPKEKKKIKPANQGGGPNYLGKQKTVTVPKKWLSDPDHVVAELAYITPREKKILLDADLYGSLKGKPNRGPGGIPSLQGDMGSVGGGGTSGGGGGDGRDKGMGMSGKTGDYSGTVGGPDDRGNAQQDANQRAQVRAGNVRAVEELIDRPTFGFTDAAKYNLLSPKSIGSGIIGLATGVPFLGSILTNMGPFDNREFYDEKVVPAGKTDLSYDDYMSARMAGQIDAYGNPIGDTGGGGGDNQLIQQAAMVNPLANPTVETPQGGVGALYAQYMRNLGYTL